MAVSSPSDDDPVPLRDIAGFFPHSKLTVGTLRAERDRELLETFFLGRREYTTLRNMREYFKRCQDVGNRRDSIKTDNASNGSYSTPDVGTAQAAPSKTLQALKRSSKSTLVTSISRPQDRTH